MQSTLSYAVLKKYPGDIFFETGSNNGLGIDVAIKAGFTKIYSLEIDEKYYNLCKEKYKDNKNVFLFLGSSINLLYDIASKLSGKIVFWLDGHIDSCVCNTVHDYPLEYEILQIGKLPYKSHNILIDDIRYCETTIIEQNKNLKLPSLNQIKARILKINNSYKFKFEDTFEAKEAILAATV